MEAAGGIGGGALKPPLANIDTEVSLDPNGITITSFQPYIIFDDVPFPEIGMYSTHNWALITNMNDVDQFSLIDWTNNLVPFNIAAGAPDNSLHISGNGNLGLGTATPAVRLDLKATATGQAAARLQNSSTTGYSGIEYLDNAGNVNLYFGIDNAASTTRLNSVNNNPILLMTNSAERVRITSGGSVGIGTASPAQKLHVYENANANSFILVENPNTGTSAAAVLRAASDTALVNFQAHASTRTISRFGKTLGGWAEFLAPAGNGLAIGTYSTVPLVLGTNSTNRIEIGGTGGVTVTGDFTVTGGTKNFAVVDPANAKSAIYFAALEGPGAGTYFRGTARMKDGEAVIDLPGYFSRITEPERLTVQLTPLGTWGQLYVAEKAPGRLVIRAAPDTSDIEFDFLVQGVRKGYLDYEVERPNTLPR